MYQLLDIPKTSTNEEIKKKYRRLALKYHPDKNPDNAEAEEMVKSYFMIVENAFINKTIIRKPSIILLNIFHSQFKKINHANHILSDEKKRALYDKYGSFGLHIAEQFGDDVVETLMMFRSKWFQVNLKHCLLQLYTCK